MRRLIACCLASSCLGALAGAHPAQAQTAQAYRSLSLMSCKQLVESLVPGEVIRHVECNDLTSLSSALTGDFPKVEGVARLTIWTVATGG